MIRVVHFFIPVVWELGGFGNVFLLVRETVLFRFLCFRVLSRIVIINFLLFSSSLVILVEITLLKGVVLCPSCSVLCGALSPKPGGS